MINTFCYLIFTQGTPVINMQVLIIRMGSQLWKNCRFNEVNPLRWLIDGERSLESLDSVFLRFLATWGSCSHVDNLAVRNYVECVKISHAPSHGRMTFSASRFGWKKSIFHQIKQRNFAARCGERNKKSTNQQPRTGMGKIKLNTNMPGRIKSAIKNLYESRTRDMWPWLDSAAAVFCNILGIVLPAGSNWN